MDIVHIQYNVHNNFPLNIIISVSNCKSCTVYIGSWFSPTYARTPSLHKGMIRIGKYIAYTLKYVYSNGAIVTMFPESFWASNQEHFVKKTCMPNGIPVSSRIV